jgi:hypothetical protein
MNCPDRDDLVADIYFKNSQVAQVFQEESVFKIQIFPSSDTDFWEFDLEQLTSILDKAQKKLLGLL